MTLQELSLEYQRTAALLAEGMGELRRQLLTARGDEAFQLKRRIDLMAEELADSVRIARVLRDYYS